MQIRTEECPIKDITVCIQKFLFKIKKSKKEHQTPLKMTNGLIQFIMMDKSTRCKRVKDTYQHLILPFSQSSTDQTSKIGPVIWISGEEMPSYTARGVNLSKSEKQNLQEHDKTNKMTSLPSKDSKWPGHPPGLTSLRFVLNG